MPGVSNTLDLAGFQAAGMLYQMCTRGPNLRSDWQLCV